ncbi:hypothetical protein FIBSPDRAFT_896595 [Athelia psychrophila]|uniref:Uncharacterized protein n=1 Tax=Athelia psychrophila TaxID=1759441 RepID=A0A166D9L7_9AGAM|nr:hypothetical protein FIBSPDRAFT_896595 [Fibularhizoctonia sp. CBS 109695]
MGGGKVEELFDSSNQAPSNPCVLNGPGTPEPYSGYTAPVPHPSVLDSEFAEHEKPPCWRELASNCLRDEQKGAEVKVAEDFSATLPFRDADHIVWILMVLTAWGGGAEFP